MGFYYPPHMSHFPIHRRAVETLQAALAGVLVRNRGGGRASRGLLLAMGASLLVIGLFYACKVEGSLPGDAFVHVAAAIVAAMIGFYGVFRSGLNRAATDPSLTVPQMVVATVIVMYAMYSADAGAADVFPNIVLMIFLFGVLRLRTRALLWFTLFILVAHAATTALRLYLHTEASDLSARLLQWVTLVVTLPWFALMGGYIRE